MGKMNSHESNNLEASPKESIKNVLFAGCDNAYSDLLEGIIYKTADDDGDDIYVDSIIAMDVQNIRQLMEKESWDVLILCPEKLYFDDGKTDVVKSIKLAVELISEYHIPVIILTVDRNIILYKDILSKVDYYFPLPFNVHEMRQAIRECLNIHKSSRFYGDEFGIGRIGKNSMSENELSEKAIDKRNGQDTKQTKSLFKKAVSLYNKGKYEDALVLFEYISENDSSLKIIMIPHIYKCERIIKAELSYSDKIHMNNQYILKYFGWINELKDILILLAILFIFLLIGNTEEEESIIDTCSKHPWFLVGAIASALFAYLLYRFMKIFNISKRLIRCKYCGHYTYYINPNEQTDNYCCNCREMYPAPDFFWDGWNGFDYIINRPSHLNKAFYEECSIIKEKYSKEYHLSKNVNLDKFYMPYLYFNYKSIPTDRQDREDDSKSDSN